MSAKAAGGRPDGRSGATAGETILLALAVVGGSAAIAAFPLFLRAPWLVLGVPLALGATARLRGSRALEVAAGVVTAVLVIAVVAEIGQVLVLIQAAGAVAALYLVGTTLMQRDRVAAGIWLVATCIGLIGGFMAIEASMATAVAAVATMTVIAVVGSLVRLRMVARQR